MSAVPAVPQALHDSPPASIDGLLWLVRLLKTLVVLTRPTLTRRDALFRERLAGGLLYGLQSECSIRGQILQYPFSHCPPRETTLVASVLFPPISRYNGDRR